MRRPLIAFTLAAGLIALRGDLPASTRCSRVPGPPIGLKYARQIYMVGTALPDTVLTGAGGINYTTGDGHFGPGPARAIHGQLFTVERIGPRELAPLPSTVSRVVLVPWDYAADCSPTPWSGSYRWLPRSERGLVAASLRDPRHWVDGLPTLDVRSPESFPYPQRSPAPPWPFTTATGPALTVDELFTLLEAAPEGARVHEAPETTLAPFRAWLQANPRLATQWPAEKVIGDAQDQANRGVRARIVPPIGGTYRFTVDRPGRDSAVFFIRTYPRVERAWTAPIRSTDSLLPVRTLRDYYVRTAVAFAEEELASRDTERDMRREGYVALVHEPRARPDGTREWAGRIEMPLIEKTLLSEMVISDRRPATASHGAFVLANDGRIRVEMVIGTANGRPITFRGERISTALVESRW